jgi:hypothetical protein
MIESTENLIANAKLEYVRNNGVLSMSTIARLSEHGLIVSDLEEQFAADFDADLDNVLES